MEGEGVGEDDVLVVLEVEDVVWVVLGPGVWCRGAEAVRAGVGVCGPQGVVGRSGGDADVGQLAVVRRTEGVQADEVQRVRVHVVARIQRDDGGGVVRLHERVVVAAHCRQTHGVLVDKRRGLDGVVAGEWVGDVVDVAVNEELVEHGDDVLGGVVGVVRLDGRVARTEEQSLDGVGESDVVRGVGRGDGRVRLKRGDLHLLDQDVTGGTAHAFTLVVGDDGVVGPHLHHVELRGHELTGHVPVGVLDGGGEHAVVVHRVGDDLVLIEQVLPVAEDEVDAHLVVRQGRGGEGHTTVAGVEQRQGQVDDSLGDGLAIAVNVGEVRERADHLVVAVQFAGRRREGAPEVQVNRRERRGDEVVEGDGAVCHQVVRQIGGPADVGRARRTRRTTGHTGVLETLVGHRGDGHTEPRVQQVVARARDLHGPLLAELGLTRCTREHHGHLGEPGRLASLPHEVRDGLQAAEEVFLQFVVRGEIDEAGGKVGRRKCRCHEIIFCFTFYL